MLIRGFATALAMLVVLNPGQTLRAEPPKVAVTITPIHSLVAAVMEGAGTPQLLVKAAVSEHTYSLRPSDARTLSNADIVIRVSENLESFLNKPIASLAKKATVVTLAEVTGMKLLPPREGGAFESHGEEGGDDGHGHGKKDAAKKDKHQEAEYDAHIWLDTDNAALIANHVAEVLGKARPEHAAQYTANAEKLKQRLAALDSEIKGQLAGLGDARFIVFHDAYHYFEARYGVTAIGSITVSPERQPGAARLKAIRGKITEAKSACVFSEPQFEPKLVGRLVEGTNARTGTLDGLGADLPEGPEQYFTMMRNLAGNLRKCLATS